MVCICCKGRGTAQEQAFWSRLPGSHHKWDPAIPNPVFRSHSNGHHKKTKPKQKDAFSFSVSSGHDPSPAEVRGRFATIPGKCRSVLLSLFPYQLCLASLLPPGFPSPAGVCQGQCPGPQAGLHRPSRALLGACAAAGNEPVSGKQPPDSPPTGSPSRDNWLPERSIRRGTPAGPRAAGKELFGNATFATCAFKFILLLQSFR